MEKIDFVITWVDGNDEEWLEEKKKYSPLKNSDNRVSRFRDWDNLQYLFRGIEKFAPWVNKIHFVTWGHIPKWLNISNPKLNIVKHEDFIPQKYLPTYSSRAIDLNLHRIPNIAEKFVYFNDDMFLINNVNQKDFFNKGLPCDSATLNAYYYVSKDNNGKDILNTEQTFMAPLFNTSIINYYFNKNEVIKKNFFKWFNLKYRQELFRSLLLIFWPKFTGFKSYHIPYSYLKSTYEELWELEYSHLDRTCLNKFRSAGDINHFIFSYWQFAKGKFTPRSINVGKRYNLNSNNEKNNENIYKAIKSKKHKMICVNDRVFEENEFKSIQSQLNNAFETILPVKSSFEI